MKRLIPILAIAFVMAFGSVSATSYTNINTNSIVTTIVSPVQDDAASADAEESLGFHQELKNDLLKEALDLWALFCYVLF